MLTWRPTRPSSSPARRAVSGVPWSTSWPARTGGVLLLDGRDPAAVSSAVAGRTQGRSRRRAPLGLDLARWTRCSAAATVVEQVATGRRAPLTTVVANAGIQVTDRGTAAPTATS